MGGGISSVLDEAQLSQLDEEMRVEFSAYLTTLGDNIEDSPEIRAQITLKYKEILNKNKWKVVFVLGGPGSGKGTNCAKIVENFGYKHLSAGDLLREERASGSDLAEMINTYIKEGKIVSAEITVGLLKAAMEKSDRKYFLVDGFPRDMENLQCWESTMSTICQVQFLLFLDCTEEVMKERLLERGKTSGRADDNLESIIKRFKTYEEQTRPIIEHFASLGLIRTVDSTAAPDSVFTQVATHFTSSSL